MMLTDRRPILLANAHILDPSRDLEMDGDLLIADGVIREAKRGIGAAGVPEATEVIDCKGKVVAPGLIDMRAFIGEPGAEYRETIASASQAAAAAGVPTAAETIMLERDMRLVALTDSRYHAASLTCSESLDVLQRAKDHGARVTASASINHLTLNEIDVGPYRTFLKLKPPLRAEEDRAALVAALAEGLIDVVMSDHNPQDVETKRLPFAEASPGAIGLETMLAAGLRLVHAGELTLLTLLKAMSSAPAKVLGLAAGTLRQGSPADVIVLDPDVPWVLDPTELKSKCKNPPFDEAKLEGRVVRTIVPGRTVYEYV